MGPTKYIKDKWYYDVKNTALILGVSTVLLCKWRFSRCYPTIEYIKLGKQFYYSEDMVKKLKALRERGVKPATSQGTWSPPKKYVTNDKGEIVEIDVKSSV